MDNEMGTVWGLKRRIANILVLDFCIMIAWGTSDTRPQGPRGTLPKGSVLVGPILGFHSNVGPRLVLRPSIMCFGAALFRITRNDFEAHFRGRLRGPVEGP